MRDCIVLLSRPGKCARLLFAVGRAGECVRVCCAIVMAGKCVMVRCAVVRASEVCTTVLCCRHGRGSV